MEDLADVPPEAFVAARDALATRLKAEGRVTEAAAVKRLRRPAVQQWLAEQVRRHHADAVDALRDATATVAAAQEALVTGGGRDELRGATAARKVALRAVADVVEQVLARHGRPRSHRDEVVAAIDAAVTAEVAGGTFGLPDDLALPDRRSSTPARERARQEAARRAAEARAEIDAAQERVSQAREELARAESLLAAVVERHRGVEGDA